ncbi:MAG: hypothetical protein LQ347_001429 [Umbilicaria vellea]|nr:MAG: hypothetical protein LQ347_001429 [Umbilicaria vellea]
MSDAYERERYKQILPFSPIPPRQTYTTPPALRPPRQNNSRLDELASKVSALRGVTVDIYDNARSHEVIDNTNEVFSSMSSSIKGSAGRLGRMAQAGNKVAILKLAAMIVGAVVLLWWILSWFW